MSISCLARDKCRRPCSQISRLVDSSKKTVDRPKKWLPCQENTCARFVLNILMVFDLDLGFWTVDDILSLGQEITMFQAVGCLVCDDIGFWSVVVIFLQSYQCGSEGGSRCGAARFPAHVRHCCSSGVLFGVFFQSVGSMMHRVR